MRNAACRPIAEKLEKFASGLSHEELSRFKEILERGGMTESQLATATHGKLSETSVVAKAGVLDANLFARLCDW